VLPTFTGDAQIYGQIALGDSNDPAFDFCVDLFGVGEDLVSVKYYFDRNKNKDLTDDGSPLEMPSLSSRKVASFDVPYSSGQSHPYSFKVYVYWADWDSTYHVAYYRDCGWTGNVPIGEGGQSVAVLLLDDDADGLYNEEGIDYACVDTNTNGLPEGAHGSEELIQHFDPFLIDDIAYGVRAVAVDGTSASFERVPFGGLTGIIGSACGGVLNGAKIECWASVTLDAVSALNGAYDVDLPEGTWNARASMPGFVPAMSPSFSITEGNVESWNVDLVPIPVPCTGNVVLYDGDSYDFAKGEKGQYTGGDFYYGAGSSNFWANNFYQRGLQDLGDLGDTPLTDVTPPGSGYTRFGVHAVAGHTYVSLAREGEEGGFIVFRVTSVTSSSVTLEFYFVNPAPQDGDPDGDGLSDWEEYVAGTSGMDPNDHFDIDAIQRNVGGGPEVFWETVSGRIYRVSRRTNLCCGVWTVIHECQGDGTLQSFVDSDGNGPCLFYRVDVRLQE